MFELTTLVGELLLQALNASFDAGVACGRGWQGEFFLESRRCLLHVSLLIGQLISKTLLLGLELRQEFLLERGQTRLVDRSVRAIELARDFFQERLVIRFAVAACFEIAMEQLTRVKRKSLPLDFCNLALQLLEPAVDLARFFRLTQELVPFLARRAASDEQTLRGRPLSAGRPRPRQGRAVVLQNKRAPSQDDRDLPPVA